MRLTQHDSRFPTHRNKLGAPAFSIGRLHAMLRLSGAGVTTAPDLPIHADDPIRNT